MTRNLVFLMSAAAALAGCASAPPDPDAPLDIRVEERAEGLRVHLSAPAHVAVFEVRPGIGVALVYPYAEGDPELLRAGVTNIGRVNRRSRVQTAPGFSDYFLYAVASRRPLEVAQFSPEEGQAAVREVIGRENAESRDLEMVMESLELAMMSPEAHASGDWAGTLLAPWERHAFRSSTTDGSDRMVNCRGREGATVVEACGYMDPGARRRGGAGGGGGGGRVQPRGRSN